MFDCGQFQRRFSMTRRKAFTLIELLVVISVIALLLSILMPSLQKAKERAKTVVCQQNLKQWGYIFGAYTEEHNGSFMEGIGPCLEPVWQECIGGGNPPNAWIEWIDVLRPYHKLNFVMGKPSEENDFQCCPTATKPMTEGGHNPFAAWGRFGDGRWVGEEGDCGSYGINMFVYNSRKGWGWGVGKVWGTTTNAKSPGNIPLLVGSQWVGGTPETTHAPPEFDGQAWGNGMTRFCLNRHPGHTVNGLFMDFNVRKIGLKELWELRWHKLWKRQYAGPPEWPDWMENFKDYAF